MHIIAGANMVMMPAASFLLFVRVKAVYSQNIHVTTFFSFCWLVMLSFFVFDSIRGILQCSDPRSLAKCFVLQHTDAWGYMANAVYDTLLYLSISWQLASFAPADRWQERLKSFFTGEGLGWLSKVLLQSGQMYYL
jgi:hypothetical protein